LTPLFLGSVQEKPDIASEYPDETHRISWQTSRSAYEVRKKAAIWWLEWVLVSLEVGTIAVAAEWNLESMA
jgi:hypothetical protein